MATLQNFDSEIAKTKQVVEEMRSKIEQSGVVLDQIAKADVTIGAADFDQLIRSLQRSLDLTVVMITHDLDSLMTSADRIAAIIDKKMVTGTVDRLRRADHPWLRSYFAGPRGRAALQAHDTIALEPINASPITDRAETA